MSIQTLCNKIHTKCVFIFVLLVQCFSTFLQLFPHVGSMWDFISPSQVHERGESVSTNGI